MDKSVVDGQYKRQYVRLPLKNACNVRDLGGYACGVNGITNWNTLLRGDDLACLDDSDIKFLLDYGVRCVIDLRAPNEVAKSPDAFANVKEARYYNFPLLDVVLKELSEVLSNNSNAAEFMCKMYVNLLQNESQTIKKILSTIADTDEGAVLFHCTVGKDRTGIIAAILLGIAGVDIVDIISNYEVTYTYTRQNPVLLEKEVGLPKELFYSDTDYLKNAIEYVNVNYGSLDGYLKWAGVSEEVLERIRKKFVKHII